MSSASARHRVCRALFGRSGRRGRRVVARELVLVDRFGTNVLTFVDSVPRWCGRSCPSDCFEANPQDYLELSEHEAFVPRLGEILPRARAFDGGVTINHDPRYPHHLVSADARRKGFRPTWRRQQLGDDVLVPLRHATANYGDGAERVVAVTIVELGALRLPLSGFKTVVAEISPRRAVLAVACSARSLVRGRERTETSGVLLLDATTDPPVSRGRLRDRARTRAHSIDLEFVSERWCSQTQTAQGADKTTTTFARSGPGATTGWRPLRATTAAWVLASRLAA